MAYSLPDGTKIDQIIWDNQALYSASGTQIISDYIPVPALYTGRLKILIYTKTQCTIRGEIIILKDDTTYEKPPYINIKYYNKNKELLTTIGRITDIYLVNFTKNIIIAEFNLPSRILINKFNIYDAYYIQIIFNYVRSTSSGNISAYLIWE